MIVIVLCVIWMVIGVMVIVMMFELFVMFVFVKCLVMIGGYCILVSFEDVFWCELCGIVKMCG